MNQTAEVNASFENSAIEAVLELLLVIKANTQANPFSDTSFQINPVALLNKKQIVRMLEFGAGLTLSPAQTLTAKELIADERDLSTIIKKLCSNRTLSSFGMACDRVFL